MKMFMLSAGDIYSSTRSHFLLFYFDLILYYKKLTLIDTYVLKQFFIIRFLIVVPIIGSSLIFLDKDEF